jgi:fibronectin type 3 domain-containing protein
VLNWTSITGANSYNLYRGAQTGGPYSLIGSLSATTYTDSSVIAGTTYFYVITAANGIGESPKSSELASTAPKP